MAAIGRDVERAVEILMSNELVAIPTETVYGLAGNGLKTNVVEKIYEVKGRPSNNPLILHVHAISGLNGIVNEIPENAIKLASEFWPGPLTLVLPKNKKVPDSVTGGLDTVAVRIPAHDLTLKLLALLDFPLAAPSANLSNRISPTTADHVNSQIGNRIQYILDGGRCDKGIESTIIGFQHNIPVIYRYGALSIDKIKEVTGEVLIKNDQHKIVAPGMFFKHYSPKTRFVATNNIHQTISGMKGKKLAVLTFMSELHNEIDENIYKLCLSEKGDLYEAAYNLYDKMHLLDTMNFDCLIAEYVPSTGIGISINDRIKRASGE